MVLARFLGGAALAAVSAPAVLAHSQQDYDKMGPLGVKWPPDRKWSEDDGRKAPCGSPDGVGERTEFPLSGGSLALEQKDVAYDLEVYISLSQDPLSNDDFKLISDTIPSLNFSHVCIDSPGLPNVASPPQPATLQFRYLAADNSHPHKRHTASNQTFYACSDVTLVLPELFTQDMPCSNVSASEHEDYSPEHPSSSGVESDVPAGVIAGIVVGCVAGLTLVGGAAWFFLRRRRRAAEKAEQAEIARQVAEADAKLRGLGTPGGTPRQGSVGSAVAA